MLKSIVLSRSRVWVIEAAMRSTLPLTSNGTRVGEVTLTNSTLTPSFSAILRTISRSKPVGSFFSSRNPKGGVSNLTPALSVPRSLILLRLSAWAFAAHGGARASRAANVTVSPNFLRLIMVFVALFLVDDRSCGQADALEGGEAVNRGKRHKQNPERKVSYRASFCNQLTKSAHRWRVVLAGAQKPD